MSIKSTQALILAPTRELAQQIQKVVIALSDYMNIECHACVGGTNVREDLPTAVLEVTKKFMRNPVRILIKILISVRSARQVLTAFY